MKRVVKKVVALAIISILVMGCLAGCGKGAGKKKGDSKTIEVAFLQQGLGIEWFEALIKGFEAKYPEYKVEYTTTSTTATLKATYGLEDTDSYDLYLGQKNYDTSCMEPLNDILETTIEGESKSIEAPTTQRDVSGSCRAPTSCERNTKSTIATERVAEMLNPVKAR